MNAIKRIVAVVLVLALAAGVFCGSFMLTSLNFDVQQLITLVTEGSLVKRTQVDSPPLSYTADAPPITYDLLYQGDEERTQLYKAAREAITGFQEYDPDQILTWADSGVNNDSQETANTLGAMFRQVLDDQPCYSVQFPFAPLNATQGGSLRVSTVGSRFMLSSTYLPPTTEESLERYGQVIDRVEELRQTALDRCDGTQRDYIAHCFSLLASGMVYSQADDEGPWYGNNIYGALLMGESECMGMSGALKALLDCEGIPNFIASGQMGGSDAGHAWVCVYSNGEWRVCDLTRCVADVTHVDPWGRERVESWQLGDVPDMSDELHEYLCGFLVPQDDYLSGAERTGAFGIRYTFGDAITMDQECYDLQRAYERLVSVSE